MGMMLMLMRRKRHVNIRLRLSWIRIDRSSNIVGCVG